jgi:hypothetical protein
MWKISVELAGKAFIVIDTKYGTIGIKINRLKVLAVANILQEEKFKAMHSWRSYRELSGSGGQGNDIAKNRLYFQNFVFIWLVPKLIGLIKRFAQEKFQSVHFCKSYRERSRRSGSKKKTKENGEKWGRGMFKTILPIVIKINRRSVLIVTNILQKKTHSKSRHAKVVTDTGEAAMWKTLGKTFFLFCRQYYY